MLKVGLTGNIGSGKTLVSKIFQTLGIEVFNADTETKNLYFQEDIKKEVCKMFGNSILDNNNNIDFKKLGDIVFNNGDKLSQLTSYIHPKVVAKYDKWCQSINKEAFCIHESAIIFEYSLQDKFDKIICVTAPFDLRLTRVLRRDKSDQSEIEKKMNNQMDENIKIARSDFIIVNDEENFLIPQIVDIYKQLIR